MYDVHLKHHILYSVWAFETIWTFNKSEQPEHSLNLSIQNNVNIQSIWATWTLNQSEHSKQERAIN